MLWGLSFFALWVQVLVPSGTCQRWTPRQRRELIFGVLVIVTSRTHLMRLFRRAVLDNHDASQRIEAGLVAQERGNMPAHPMQLFPTPSGWARAQALQLAIVKQCAPRWASRWAVFLYMMMVLVAILMWMGRQELETGRRQIWGAGFSVAIGSSGAGFLFYGPSH